MSLRGQAAAAGGGNRLRHTAASATSGLVRIAVRRTGLETEVTVESGGDFAYFESDLRPTGEEGFQEAGAISFGDANEHILRFSTIGEDT